MKNQSIYFNHPLSDEDQKNGPGPAPGPQLSLGKFAKSITLLLLLLCAASLLHAQKHMENLGRGVVAVRTSSSQVFVSWRMLGTDPTNVAFNLYRGTTKVNGTPLSGATNYTDNTSTNSNYTVRPVINGQEGAASAAAAVWTEPLKRLPLQRPGGGTTPDGVSYTYSPNDCSVGDLDGDGEYEIIVKWDPSNSKDNSQSGYTGNVYLDAYKMNGTRMWRIDLGRNIRAGAHYTQFIVYDLDSDGKAELACKTADGTRDGRGTVIGNGSADYRNSSGYILSGPEYLTVFNGQTGAAMATTNYLPGRGTVSSWGDGYGNRVDRFLAGVGYFDGQRPSLLMTRGYYTRSVLVAWDWRNGQLTQRWTFDSNTSGNSAYAGQGDHSLSINDVDGDGRDEVVFGSMVVDDNGRGLYSTGLGHGDALHVGDLNPDRPGQEVWEAHEDASKYAGNGLWFRDARTGQRLFGVPATGDVGRGLAADIDPRHKGYELWGSVGGLYNVNGQQISTAKPGSANFASWWDGDLQREILNGTTIDKWNYSNSSNSRLLTAYNYGAAQNNGTKANPGLSADILGDWREEAIYRNSNNTELLIFTTTIPTTHKFYTLMHDPQYRVAVAWQNVGYNQPPHTSFYLGGGMSAPPRPNITLVGSTPGSIKLGATGGNGQVDLSWTVTNLSLSGQEVYRDTDADPAGRVRITSLSSGTRSYTDNTVQNGTTYYYWIKANTSSGSVVNSSYASATPANGLNGIYTITARHSGKALDVYEYSQAHGGNIVQWTNLGGINQQWRVTSLGGGYHSIISVHSGLALDVKDGSTADGANIQQWGYSGGTHQQWLIRDLGTGYYSIIGRKSGKSIDINSRSTADGANVLQWTYTGGTNQQFRLLPVNTNTRTATSTEASEGKAVEQDWVQVYPNPSSESFLIQVEGTFNYHVYDVQGKVVEQGKGKNNLKVGSKLVPGLYTISIEANGIKEQHKVIKQ